MTNLAYEEKLEWMISGRSETGSNSLLDLSLCFLGSLHLLEIDSDWTESRCSGKCIQSQTDGETFSTANY